MLPKNRRVPLKNFPKNSRAVVRTDNFVAKRSPNNISYNRAGVITPKSAGSAAQRNALRRLIMRFFEKAPRFWGKSITGGTDFVIIVSAGTGKRPLEGLKQELKNYGKLF